ncbi:ABC transporter substrate-binding protein [Paenibacillus sp. GSMTC-2017]|uniref:ABC transporter substrate-binding protein n=1 Tax=Paenibacillus sp. GSMTC-2017 TaxID=2794350 RepID=UPI0018D7C86A|nr:ABC transporter substrate-binding protein [Paenibacillus sp. GSMTC-2017]MBH5318293.1 ABC transporter substrate-binding protein [Paenibacillus sp. GSMTC-2017]
MLQKRTLLLIALVFVVIFVSACGNGQGTNNKGGTGEATETAVVAETADISETRVYKSSHGDVEIPKIPKRIVAGGHLGSMIALGVKPVGAVKEWEADSPFLEGKVDGITDIGDPHDMETIISLKPDLIVLSYADDVEPFSKIAPTVLIPYESLKSVEEQITVIAELLGKEQEGKDWLAQFDENVVKSRDKVKSVIGENKSATIVAVMDGTAGFLGDRFGRGGQVLYRILGMKAPEKVQKLIDGDGTVETVSLEILPEVAGGDYVFLSSFIENDPAKDDLLQSGVWKNLDAVKNNRMFELDHQQFYFSDPISIQGQLNLITEMLTRK